ncbi:hypothetical protein SAMN05661091_3224 [Paenibacillus uliginis N3/975]|uniref:Uncharacterized protein n=1 Tax=Paenibacillus uliginis N3/975 TaxID=1313296 RepID=A0A1X7HFX0_9BACL|nr:hypothetical protein SAMN05661091_3224 [Paenibacillus uliginis N3/975]
MKRERLLKYLLERADTAGQNRIVFFLDDTQRLREILFISAGRGECPLKIQPIID